MHRDTFHAKKLQVLVPRFIAYLFSRTKWPQASESSEPPAARPTTSAMAARASACHGATAASRAGSRGLVTACSAEGRGNTMT